MGKGPHKPIELMTDHELRDWRQWLLREGKEPRSIPTPRASDGSAFEYDNRTREVFECARDGSRHAVAIQEGQIRRIQENPGEPLKDDLRHLAVAEIHGRLRLIGVAAIQGLVLLALIAFHLGLIYVIVPLIPSVWTLTRQVLDVGEVLIFGAACLAILLDALVMFARIMRSRYREDVPQSSTSNNLPIVAHFLVRLLVGR